LSLRYNVRTEGAQADFETITNLEGVYIANVYQRKAINMLKYEKKLESIDTP